jgi:hypothetical protein
VTPVLAVAGNLLRELARRPAALGFAALVIVIAAALPHLEGNGALRSRLQVAVAHGTGLPVFLAIFALVFVAAGSIARDLERGQAQTLAVTPVGRPQILLGKLAGSALAGAALLAMVFVAMMVNLRVIGAGAGTAGEQEAAREHFFTPRRSVPASIPALGAGDIAAFAAAAGEEAREWSPREAESRARRARSTLSVGPGQAASVVFEGLRGEDGRADGSQETLVLRFVLQAPSRRSGFADCIWEAREADGGAARFAERVTAAVGLPREIRVPAGLAAGGRLALVLRNPAEEEDARILADLARTEALEPHGAFLGSAVRAFLVIGSRAVFLAAVGILGGTLFTFPTATLLGSFVYLTAVLSSFLREACADLAHVHGDSLAERVAAGSARVGEAVLGLFPDFSSFDPLGRLAAGRAITDGELLAAASWTGGVQAGAVFLAACLLFARRELAGKGAR